MRNKIINGLAGIVLAGSLYFSDGLNAVDIDTNNLVVRINDVNYPIKKSVSVQRTEEHLLIINNRKSPNYSSRMEKNIEGIVIHSTEGSGGSALNWLINPQSKVSAHYLVMEDGVIYQLVDDLDKAWHAGRKANLSYIGIEIAGYANKKDFSFTDLQYDRTGLLLSHLMKKHKLTRENVVSHGWISKNLGGTSHTDPGPNFKWDQLDKSILKYFAGKVSIERK